MCSWVVVLHESDVIDVGSDSDSSDDSGIDIPGKQGSFKQHKKISTTPVIQSPKSWEYAKEVDRLF